jgi:hypothetical protein
MPSVARGIDMMSDPLCWDTVIVDQLRPDNRLPHRLPNGLHAAILRHHPEGDQGAFTPALDTSIHEVNIRLSHSSDISYLNGIKASHIGLHASGGLWEATLPSNLALVKSLYCFGVLPVIEQKMPSLTEFHFEEWKEQAWPQFRHTLLCMPNLTHLTIACWFPSGEGESFSIPRLESLSLLQRLGEWMIESIHKGRITVPNLKSLTIKGNTYSEWFDYGTLSAVLQILQKRGHQLHSLHLLDFAIPPFNDIAEFPLMKGLREVTFSGNGAEVYGAKLLCEAPHLLPDLSHIVLSKLSTKGEEIHSWATHYMKSRAPGTKVTIEVRDCPHVLVAEMRSLRLLRE